MVTGWDLPSAGARAVPAPMFDLDGHVALVTGGNSGIGLGMACGLASAGARVVIWGTSAERNAAAVARIGPSAAAMCVNVADEDAVTAAVAAVADQYGSIDSCFANAGVAPVSVPLLDTSLDDLHRVTRVNLDGAFVTMREAARQMIAREVPGSIVATSSLSVLMGQAGAYGYAASKAALVAIVKGMAVEVARHGIRVNALLPGWTEAGMTADVFASERFTANVLPRVPLRRWATGEDYAGIAVYLASAASGFHTGGSILIDGGYAAF